MNMINHADPAMQGILTALEFSKVLAAVHCAPDAAHAALPSRWQDKLALIHTLIEDEGMETTQVAREAGVPVALIAGYRAELGI